MKIQASVFIATSMDGFIAREDGSLDWLDRANAAVPEGEDCGYKAFMGSVDALVMGRGTFEAVLGFDFWPYSEKRTLVLSSRGVAVPEHLRGAVEITAEAPRALLERLESEGVGRVYVDGGRTIQGFLREGLIADLTITRIPVLLGAGRPLFGSLPADIHLEHTKTIAYPFGFVQSVYRVIPST